MMLNLRVNVIRIRRAASNTGSNGQDVLSLSRSLWDVVPQTGYTDIDRADTSTSSRSAALTVYHDVAEAEPGGMLEDRKIITLISDS